MDLISETREEQNGSEPLSPLGSMSLTTDTLSVRQSHIGTTFPDSRVMVNEYQKSIQTMANISDVREIIPYPPDIISTTVERSTGTDWGYQSKTPLISNQKNRFNKNSDRTRLKRMSSQESVSTNDFLQDCNGFDKQSVVSLQSLGSGIESNHSNDTNLLSIECRNACNQTENKVMINEYIQVSISDDSSGPLFDLRRKLALESGKAEQLSHIMDDMVKERSDLQMKLHSIDKELKVKNQKICELNAQRESLLSECEELKSGINKWESIVNDYIEVVDAKKIEIQALSEDIIKMSENNENIQINCEHLKIDLESKENTIKELNKKISQMNIEINSFIQTKVSLEEEIKRKKSEIEEISSQRDWFELELNKLQVQLNETHQKLVSEQQISITARNNCEKAQTLNAVLKQELIEVKHKTVREKEGLMRHLEGIGAQLIQKQTEMQLLSPNEDMISSHEFNELSTDLKQKLFDKNKEIENLSRELIKLKDNNQRLVSDNKSFENHLSSTLKQSSDKDYEIQTLKSYNSDLELKIRGLNVDLKRQKELNEILRKDKKDSESKLNALVIDNKTLETTTKQLKETIEKHERSLKQFQSNLIAKETKLDLIERERSKLSNIIQIREQELSQIKQNLSINTSDDQRVDISELKIQNQELEKVMNSINTELRANQIRFDEQKNQLLTDCSHLKTQLSEEKLKFEDLLISNEKINKKLKLSENTVIELQTELNSLKLNNNNIKTELSSEFETNNEIIKIKNEKIRSLESNVKLLTKKYREVIEYKKEMEEKLKNSFHLSENVTKVFVSTQTEDLYERGDHSELTKDNEDLRNEIERLREEILSKDSVIGENQKIILKLEHEKGKLSSAGENSTNEHILSLEVLIASKSEEVLDLTESLNEKTKSLKELEIKLNKKISEIETDLKKERAVVKDLRHSIFADKRENNYLKKDLNELKRALSESNAIADKRKQEVIDIEDQMKNLKLNESSVRNEIERINNELKITKEENSRLNVKLENSSKKNEPLLEQLKNLSLNLMEKNQEIEGLKSQFNSVRERYESEVQSLRQRIDSYESDSQKVNNELNEIRKTNFSLESRLTELRVVLKNSYDQNKKLRQQLNACQVVVSQESTFNEELVAKLLDQSADNKKEIKPLVNLQACVDSLKMEMQLLQKQISDHNN